MKDRNGSKKLYFIDTNIFLRVLVKDDESYFEDCLNLLKLVAEKKVRAFTSSVVLLEVNFVLGSFYKFGKGKVVEALESIVNLSHLKIMDDTNPRFACELYKTSNVKFTDCLIASSKLIFQKKAEIISYDQDFDRLDINRRVPADFT